MHLERIHGKTNQREIDQQNKKRKVEEDIIDIKVSFKYVYKNNCKKKKYNQKYTYEKRAMISKLKFSGYFYRCRRCIVLSQIDMRNLSGLK